MTGITNEGLVLACSAIGAGLADVIREQRVMLCLPCF